MCDTARVFVRKNVESSAKLSLLTKLGRIDHFLSSHKKDPFVTGLQLATWETHSNRKRGLSGQVKKG